MGAVYNEIGAPKEYKGKLCEFTEDKIKIDAPDLLYIYEESKFDISKALILKERIEQTMIKKGFVFYDDIYYRYTLKRNGRLRMFGLNFIHIK